MKHIFVNLKRFDIRKEYGGINGLFPARDYGQDIIKSVNSLMNYKDGTEYVFYFSEADIISALKESEGTSLKVGCQSVFSSDVEKGGNFGAFTSLRTASSMASLGVKNTIIGHCEERNNFRRLFSLANNFDPSLINKELKREVDEAIKQGLDVLFCVGEREEETSEWEKTIKTQLEEALDGIDLSKIVIAYEPVWSIGPGKTPASKEHITRVASLIKSDLGNVDVVYGGGLKKENAEMLKSIKEISGGLIALTRFSGDIGFYPEEYKEIVDLYLGE